MGSYTEQFTEGHALLGTIVPAVYTGVQVTPHIDVANYNRVVVIIHLGATSQNFNALLNEYKVATGGTPKAITGKAITQLTGGDDDKSVAIELRTEELDVDGGYHWIELSATPAGASVAFCAEVWGFEPRFAPVDTSPFAEVVP